MSTQVAPTSPTRTAKLLAALGGVGLALVLALPLIFAVSTLNRMVMLLVATAPLLVLVVLNVEFGLYLLLAYSSVLAFLIRMLPPTNSGPIGIALDGLLVLMGLRLLYDLARRRDWQIFSGGMTTPVVVFLLFQCVEVFNPAAPSIFYGIWGLRVTLRILGFFLVIYYLRERGALVRLIGFFLGLMALVGAYGIFQHHHGLLWQEMNWLLTEGNAATHIVGGYVRVFSTVGDASTFGFLMIMSSLIMISLAMTSRPAVAALLGLGTFPMLYGCVVSYSRGPVVALAFGIGVMVLASRNWKLAIAASTVGALGLTLLIASGSHQLVDRLSTAKDPTQDASFQVRVGYIEQYLPQIAVRPFGFGINTSGGNAAKVNSSQDLRNTVIGVPTDCYYFKVALEMGWVGLMLFVWLHIVAILETYKVYRKTLDPTLKAIALGLFGVLCCLFAGSFSNDLHAQKPISEFFWIALGIVTVIGQLNPMARRVTPPHPLPLLPPGNPQPARRVG